MRRAMKRCGHETFSIENLKREAIENRPQVFNRFSCPYLFMARRDDAPGPAAAVSPAIRLPANRPFSLRPVSCTNGRVVVHRAFVRHSSCETPPPATRLPANGAGGRSRPGRERMRTREAAENVRLTRRAARTGPALSCVESAELEADERRLRKEV